MRPTKILQYLLIAIGAILSYLALVFVAIQQSWITRAIADFERLLIAAHVPAGQAADLASNFVGSLLQALTVGAILFGLGLLVRSMDMERRRAFLARQAAGDYHEIVEALRKLHSSGGGNGYERGDRYLRYLLTKLGHHIDGLEGRPSQFVAVIGVDALGRFEEVTKGLDNVWAFVNEASSWNDGISQTARDTFMIRHIDNEGGPSALAAMQDGMRGFIKALKQPVKLLRGTAATIADLQKDDTRFIKVQTT